MASKVIDLSDKQLEKIAEQFIHDHPEIKEALDLFDIADEAYQKLLVAEEPTTYITTNSTAVAS